MGLVGSAKSFSKHFLEQPSVHCAVENSSAFHGKVKQSFSELLLCVLCAVIKGRVKRSFPIHAKSITTSTTWDALLLWEEKIYIDHLIQSPSPRRRKCSKSSSCSDVASIPPHTSTLTLVILMPPSSGKNNITKKSDISCFYSPSSMLVKVTQVSTQHLLAQSSAAVQCNSPHNALLEKFPPAAAALHPLANIHPLHINPMHSSSIKLWPQKGGQVHSIKIRRQTMMS